MAKTIEARVWQKVDTEANWLANPLPLGAGEQAFVSDKHNFKLNDTDGFKMFSELEYFYKGDILGSVKTTDDLNAKPDGVYRAETSGTYAGVVVKEGYYTLLRKENGNWKLESETKIPMQDLTPINNRLDSLEIKVVPNGGIYLGQTEKSVNGDSIEKFTRINSIGQFKHDYADNFGYEKNSIVLADNVFWKSLVDVNKDYPSKNSLEWQEIKVSVVDENYNPNSLNAQSGNAVSEALEAADKMIGSISVPTEGSPQLTTNGNATNTGVSTVHGYSFPVGVIPLQFNKVNVPFAQNTSTPITQLEIRLFENSATGNLVVKKRVSFAASGSVQTSVDVVFDEIIKNNNRLWCQVLVNNPFAVKRVSPAVIFTSENGYEPPKATTVNNLDGTTFATNQSPVDVLLTFNSVISATTDIDFTSYGKQKVIDIIEEQGIVDDNKIDLVWNCVGHSIWAQDELVYPSTTTIAVGIQTLIKRTLNFYGYNKWCYSGRSLGATSESGDTSSITNYFNTWTDTRKAFWTLDTITNDFKRNIPIGTISDYNNNTGVMTYYGALRRFKDKVTSLSGSNTPIVIVSNAMNRNNGGYTSTSTNTVGATLYSYEQALMQVAQINGWRFLDQRRFSGIYDDNLNITTLDGLHPNNFGYSICYDVWLNKLKNILT